MTVVFTAGAQTDLEEIFRFTSERYPAQLSALQARMRDVMARVEGQPKSAPAAAGYPGVRVVLLLRYPFKIFYREIPDGIEILYIRHTARRSP